MTTGFRTLFLGREPTWDAWLRALEENWAVAVRPTLVAPKQPGTGAYADHYHQFHLPDPLPGRHTAAATVRVIETGAEAKREVEFVV